MRNIVLEHWGSNIVDLLTISNTRLETEKIMSSRWHVVPKWHHGYPRDTYHTSHNYLIWDHCDCSPIIIMSVTRVHTKYPLMNWALMLCSLTNCILLCTASPPLEPVQGSAGRHGASVNHKFGTFTGLGHRRGGNFIWLRRYSVRGILVECCWFEMRIK